MDPTTFSSLGLVEPQLSAVSARGYERPTPIQCLAIPPLLEGRDLLGTAQTGTGKTAAFALPIVQRLRSAPRIPRPGACRALVVTPTRELAAQIDASFEAYGRGARLSRACVFGGVGKAPQVRALERGADVLVATPGRLLDLHAEGRVRLDSVETVVLDEADRMLDMGFIRDVRKIVALLPERRQTLLFSATMPDDIAQLAARILRDPVRVSVSPERPAVELIEQSVAYVEKEDKRAFISALIRERGHDRAMVFTRTKHGADRLARSLEREGVSAAAIHANKSQNNRSRTLEGFRTGEIRVLVATDLAARGLDVEGISHVYNYELPDVAETYVHRIGRTARAGAEGRALALCDSEERPLLRAIEKLMRRPVPAAAGDDIEAARLAAGRAREEAERARAEVGDAEAAHAAGSAARRAPWSARLPRASGNAAPRAARSAGPRVGGGSAPRGSGGAADGVARPAAGRAAPASSLRKRGRGGILGSDREVDRGQYESRRAGSARRLPPAGPVSGRRSSRSRPG